METRPLLLAFNRGMISSRALARVDLKRMALSAEIQTNWMPKVLGSMSLRPGTRYLHNTLINRPAIHIPFVFALDDTALLEITNNCMRVSIDDELITRPVVATTLAAPDLPASFSVTIPIGAAATITHGGGAFLQENDPIFFTITADPLPGGLALDTVYYAKNVSGSTTKISAYPGGPAITTTGVSGTGYFLVGGNIGTNWTDSDDAGCNSGVVPSATTLFGDSSMPTVLYSGQPMMYLKGTSTAYAIRDASFSVTTGDQALEHSAEIFVYRGSIELSIGTSLGDGSVISRMVLNQGLHSIAFTPTAATMYIRIAHIGDYVTYVQNVSLSTGGTMELVNPIPVWPIDTTHLCYDQSGDVIFLADGENPLQRIERHGPRSWSVATYVANDGPFLPQNTTECRMSVSNLNGTTTLTATRDYFKSTNLGSLFRLGSLGQTVSSALTAADTYTDYIRVVGIDNGRTFTVSLAGTWSGTLTLQRSVSEPGDWTDVKTYTGVTSVVYDDTLDNQEVYYRIGFKAGAYTSGTCTAGLIYASGTIEGVGRVIKYVDRKNVVIEVLKNFGSTNTTPDWWEGAWSTRRGFPSAVAFHDGRLWWAGKDKIAGSVSDAFSTFDDQAEGDSGPIFRSIGKGPVDTINWLVSLSSLIVGGQSQELVAKASSLDEPLTPTAFSLKTISTQGSARIQAVPLDASAVYVHRNGSRVYEVSMDSSTYSYASNDLTSVIPDIGASGFRRIAVQRAPDTRIHCVRLDGKVAILVFDRLEKVTCWILWETDGEVEDVAILPATNGEDRVYYTVNRTLNGATVRCVEQWALDAETLGAATTVLADSCFEYSGAATATITGLSRFNTETVCVWGNGKDLGTYTVSGGSITLPEAVTYACIGIPYTANFKSAKFSEASEIALNQKQQIHHVGFVLADTHAQGITFGQDFDHLDDLPQVEEGAVVDLDSIWSDYTMDSIPVNGAWTNDTRLCLRAASPRPCTVLAAIVSVTGHGK